MDGSVDQEGPYSGDCGHGGLDACASGLRGIVFPGVDVNDYENDWLAFGWVTWDEGIVCSITARDV